MTEELVALVNLIVLFAGIVSLFYALFVYQNQTSLKRKKTLRLVLYAYLSLVLFKALDSLATSSFLKAMALLFVITALFLLFILVKEIGDVKK